MVIGSSGRTAHLPSEKHSSGAESPALAHTVGQAPDSMEVAVRGVRETGETQKGELHEEWGHLHTFLKQGHIQRFGLRQRGHHISTKNCSPQTVDQDPGPSETSGPLFQRGNNMFFVFPFLRRLTHPLEHFLGAEMLWEIKVSLHTAPKGKGRKRTARDWTMRQGKVMRFRLTSHHSPHYLEFLNVPNIRRPRSVFHDHRLYPESSQPRKPRQES